MRTLDPDQYWPGVKAAEMRAAIVGRHNASAGLQQAVDEPQPQKFAASELQIIAAHTVRRTAAIWGGLGFVAGMLAWHLIGFWSFVANVAFNDDQRVVANANGSTKLSVLLRKSKPIANGNSLDSIHAGNCIALEIDRTSGAAKPNACPVDEKPLADAGRTSRDDLAFSRPRLQDPQIWTNGRAVKSEVTAEAIDESSFDLTISPEP